MTHHDHEDLRTGTDCEYVLIDIEAARGKVQRMIDATWGAEKHWLVGVDEALTKAIQRLSAANHWDGDEVKVKA